MKTYLGHIVMKGFSELYQNWRLYKNCALLWNREII